MGIYTAGCVARPSGSWSSGYDIALTQRRSPVRIRSSPSLIRSEAASMGHLIRRRSMSYRRGERGDEYHHQGKASQRNQGEPPRLITEMHVICDDEACLDRRHNDEKNDSEGVFKDGEVAGRRD